MPEKTSCKLEIGLLPEVRGTPFSKCYCPCQTNMEEQSFRLRFDDQQHDRRFCVLPIVKKIDREMIMCDYYC